MKGKFIVIEGLEGAGKSTAISLVKEMVEASGFSTVCTREPGGTPMAEAIRNCVKQDWGDENVTLEAELLLMYAARCQLLENVIYPALKNGQWVIGDRHDMSSLAYQGGGRGIAEALFSPIREFALKGFRPDFTLYLDVTPEIGLERARGRGDLDRIEQEDLAFFTNTRNRYLELARSNPNTVIVNTEQDIKQVHRDIRHVVSEYLSQ